MNRLVSCLCVTRGRAPLLEGAVSDFAAQTHPSRELVVVHGAADAETASYMDGLAAGGETPRAVRRAGGETPRAVRRAGVEVRVLRALGTDIVSVRVTDAERRPLGALRNLAVDHARGRYVCQWDDDDLHAPSRVAVQLEAVEGGASPVCTLERLTFYDREHRAAFRSFARDEGWDGTLLCERAVMPRYPDIERAEDTAVLYEIAASHRVTAIRRPDLYVYVLHGQNTWHRAHFDALLAASTRLPDAEAATYERLVAERYGSGFEARP